MSVRALTIPAGEFKTKCLQLMDEVNETHIPITITKHGVPIAKLVSIDETEVKLFGSQKGIVSIKGDIISPIDEHWEVNE
jgi:prevent-host-death family protein